MTMHKVDIFAGMRPSALGNSLNQPLLTPRKFRTVSDVDKNNQSPFSTRRYINNSNSNTSPISDRSRPPGASDGETSFILSDGGTRRTKYADIVSSTYQCIHIKIYTILAALTNALRPKKVPSWWNKWVYIFTDRCNTRFRNDYLLLRSAAEWNHPWHLADSSWSCNLLLHWHAARQGIQSHPVQPI